MFVNREAELAHLERLYTSRQAELFVLYGRRRLGKTELLRSFCQGKPNVFSILRAIAQGRTRLNEIAQSAGVGDSPITARYLDTLQQMRIVRRTVLATESQPQKSKKGLYRIADAFLRFWFRFVHPHQGALGLGLADAVLAQRVRPTFDQFVSYAFEEAAAAVGRERRRGRSRPGERHDAEG